jgi:hypothetical protein
VGEQSPHADDVIELAVIAGLMLDEWQQNVLRWSLMTNGQRWAAREVGLVVARQNGKGTILEARQLAGLFILNERLGVHSAHEFKTCYEHFRRVVGLVEDTPELSKYVKIIRTGAGDQAIELKNGNRLRFIARSRASGRGFSGDAVYLDEAFELSDATIGALLPALSARPNPQLWLTSSAPHNSSEVLHRTRERGRSGGDPRLLYCEWGNEPDADPSDAEAWRRANPALGIRINEESIESERQSMSPAEFARERLGVPDMPDGHVGVIDMAKWNAAADQWSKISGPVEIALELSPDRLRASFAVAGRRADGLAHVELIDQFSSTAGVVARGVELSKKYRTPIIVDPGSPAGALIPSLTESGADVHEVSLREVTQSCGAFVDAVNTETVRHIGQSPLSAAVAAGRQRSVGDAVAWARLSSSADVTPLVAASLALGRVPAKRRPVVFVDVA